MKTIKKRGQKKLKFKEIYVSDLCPGIKFDAPVYIDEENLFLLEGIPLKQKEIERLHYWDIESVYTEGNIINERVTSAKDKNNIEVDEKIEENKYQVYYDSVIRKYKGDSRADRSCGEGPVRFVDRG